ncbi:xanthine dehydrogenase, partial [Hyalella azteca]|uniref:Xanthine dehydrogenase n=1 Tax=Hyalella azteca TaxID=294128 RepID=A0A8B7P5Q0_HYAAZ
MAPQGDSEVNAVSFVLNGEEHTVSPPAVPLDMRLVDYVRYHVGLPGTKVMCREGGCGACIVVATAPDLGGGGTRTFSVQACQLLVYACANWQLETIEHLGGRKKGYHKIQQALAGFYGTQCGYCSPGMVMTMAGELGRKGTVTSGEVEGALDGNLCRCTGYRPILDAFKSLAGDGAPALKQRLADIEEAYKTTCPRTGQPCAGKLSDGTCRSQAGTTGTTAKDGTTTLGGTTTTGDALADARPSVTAGKERWFHPVSGVGVMNALKMATPQDKVLLVGGNTGAGVFKNDGPYTMFISLAQVPEMQQVNIAESPIKLGARLSLNQCIDVFRSVCEGPKAVAGYGHLKEMADHWQVVANLAVRNNGSWAGNLAMKNRHKNFPSDVFLTLAAIDAQILVANAATQQPEQHPVLEVPQLDLRGKVIVAMLLPPLPAGTRVRSYKITPRAVNAHAYVNAALRLLLGDDLTVKEAPRLLFGGLGEHFVSASNTERYLIGKRLSDVSVVREAARLLAEEATPHPDPHQGSPEYRRSLVQCLFYKMVVGVVGGSPRVRSAGDKIVRGLSSGQQSFDETPDTWPVGQPLPKIESLVQVAGEAQFADDVPLAAGELHAYFVQATQACAAIDSVDATQALAVPGVVDFVTAADIPGKNSYFAMDMFGPVKPDPVFAVDRTLYHGQPLGLIVARDRATAEAATKLVKVTYSDIKKPVVSIQEAIKKDRLELPIGWDGKPASSVVFGDQDGKGLMEKASHRVKGKMEVPSQYHFTMELMTARVMPLEDGYDVIATTQFMQETQKVVAEVLNVPANSLNLTVRRLGGGFGHKVSRCNLSACAVAVAAAKLRRPVRLFQDLRTNMSSIGWREPYYASYEVGFSDTGRLEAVAMEVYSGVGHVPNESTAVMASNIATNVYFSPSWTISPQNAILDTAANTWCRTPGHVEYIAFAENIMDHVAAELGKDPLEVREINILNIADEKQPADGGPNVFKTSILPVLKEKAMLEQRKLEVEQFNRENRWRKRGLAVTPMKYPYDYPPLRYGILVSIYEQDGTIAISHGGIEMGQGMNTKAVQVAAATMGLPMQQFIVKPTSNVTTANSTVTGGSFGSDLVCQGVKLCCERLKARLDAFKATQDPAITWPELVKKAILADVDISERYWPNTSEFPKGYTIWGGACVEVEVDVLTGMHVIRRADVVEDAG